MLKSTIKRINQIKELGKEYIDLNINAEGSWRQPSWHLFQDEMLNTHPELESTLYKYSYVLLNYFHEYRETKRELIKAEKKKEYQPLIRNSQTEDSNKIIVPKGFIDELTELCEENNVDPIVLKNISYDLREAFEDKNVILWNYVPKYDSSDYSCLTLLLTLFEKYKVEENKNIVDLCNYLWNHIGERAACYYRAVNNNGAIKHVQED